MFHLVAGPLVYAEQFAFAELPVRRRHHDLLREDIPAGVRGSQTGEQPRALRRARHGCFGKVLRARGASSSSRGLVAAVLARVQQMEFSQAANRDFPVNLHIGSGGNGCAAQRHVFVKGLLGRGPPHE